MDLFWLARRAATFENQGALFFAVALRHRMPFVERVLGRFQMMGGVLIVGRAHGHDAVGFRFHLGQADGVRMLGNFVQRLVHLLVIVFANPGQRRSGVRTPPDRFRWSQTSSALAYSSRASSSRPMTA